MLAGGTETTGSTGCVERMRSWQSSSEWTRVREVEKSMPSKTELISKMVCEAGERVRLACS